MGYSELALGTERVGETVSETKRGEKRDTHFTTDEWRGRGALEEPPKVLRTSQRETGQTCLA